MRRFARNIEKRLAILKHIERKPISEIGIERLLDPMPITNEEIERYFSSMVNECSSYTEETKETEEKLVSLMNKKMILDLIEDIGYEPNTKGD